MKIVHLFILLLLSGLFAAAQHVPKGLHINDSAPVFTAMDQNGKSVSLRKLLMDGPVVLVFYRGQWCPHCNKQLKNLEDSLSFIKAKGATVIAITPEKPESITKTIEKTKASYSIVFDEGLKIMKNYDVAFAVDTKTIERYKGYGIDFDQANGSNGANLPVPALFIIGKDGKIIYRHFDTNYTKRASITEVLAHL